MMWKFAVLMVVALAGCQSSSSNAIDFQPGMTPQLATTGGNPYMPPL